MSSQDKAGGLPEGLPPPRLVRTPSTALPAGTWDTHVHVIGPVDRYPLDPARGYTPPCASLEAYRDVMNACGIAHAVLVQPSVYGHDHHQLLDALRAAGSTFRGVAVPRPDTSDAELDEMHALGVRGVRLNLVNRHGLAIDDALRLLDRTKARGWHLDLQVRWDDETTTLVERLATRSDVALVFDHFGRPIPRGGAITVPPLLIDLLKAGRGWIKLSAPYRVVDDAQAAGLAPLVRAMVDANADRVLWASDWPHTERFTTMPHVSDLVDVFTGWLTEARLRRRVAVDNPQRLYDH
jgi:predicted TIM-barrel fold metal-dependent hydrolase